jgi:hypothetical protein
MDDKHRRWKRDFSVQHPDDWAQVSPSNLPEEVSMTANVPIARFEKAGSEMEVAVAHCPEGEGHDFQIETLKEDGILHCHGESNWTRVKAATSAIIYMMNHLDDHVRYKSDDWRHRLDDIEERAEKASGQLGDLKQTVERLNTSIERAKEKE